MWGQVDPKRHKEKEKPQSLILVPLFICFFLLPLSLPYVNWASQEGLFASPEVLSEKAVATHSSTLAWKIPWTEEPGRLKSMGSLKVRHDWGSSLSLFTLMHWRRKWQPTPVFLPGESQGQGWGGLPSMGSHRVGHDWNNLATAAAAAADVLWSLDLSLFYLHRLFSSLSFSYDQFGLLFPILSTSHSPLKRWEAQFSRNRGTEVSLATSCWTRTARGIRPPPLPNLKLRSLYSSVHLEWVIFSMVDCSFIYHLWSGTACCILLTWAETKWVGQSVIHGSIISSINTVITRISRGIS